MTKAAASLAVTLLALDALSQPCSAEAQPFAYPPKRVAWIVGQRLFNYNGDPWPGPPWAWPILTPRYGCYVFHQHLAGAWRRVEECE